MDLMSEIWIVDGALIADSVTPLNDKRDVEYNPNHDPTYDRETG